MVLTVRVGGAGCGLAGTAATADRRTKNPAASASHVERLPARGDLCIEDLRLVHEIRSVQRESEIQAHARRATEVRPHSKAHARHGSGSLLAELRQLQEGIAVIQK